jgi:Mn2+/Fe2+ NRAMP family transporter
VARPTIQPTQSAEREIAAEQPAPGKGPRRANPFVCFLQILDPGFITGASDDDLSGIGTYAVAGASLVGMLINFVGINPIAALFWTAVINGFLAPPLLAVIPLIANNRAIIGNWTNHPLANVLGWITVALMTAAALWAWC